MDDGCAGRCASVDRMIARGTGGGAPCPNKAEETGHLTAPSVSPVAPLCLIDVGIISCRMRSDLMEEITVDGRLRFWSCCAKSLAVKFGKDDSQDSTLPSMDVSSAFRV